jgi:dipeptidase E
MRLFLASRDFGNFIDGLKELVSDGKKTLFIFNARDGKNKLYRWWRLKNKKQALKRAGFQAIELDLREYFGKEKKLRDFIDTYQPNLIYAFGGNVFVLRRAFAQSGFDKILIEDLRQDKYVYAGGSAGSIITHPLLKYYVNPDDLPDVVPRDYQREVIWQGLDLTNNYTIPHTDALWFANDVKIIVDLMKEDKIKPIELKDSDVLVVDGKKKEVLRCS